MKLVPCKFEDVVEIKREERYRHVYKTLMDFIKTGEKCVEIEDYPQKNAKSCHGSFKNSIKRYNLDNTVDVFIRGQRVFLIRK